MRHLTRTLLSAVLVIAATGPILGMEPGVRELDSQRNFKDLQDPSRICATAIAQIERTAVFPRRLLFAIALTETGRWNKRRQAGFAWPWSVTAGGSGKFFDTRIQAIKHVRVLQAKGVSNIDVGCMQINLKYHPNAFDNLEQAFDP